MSEPRTLSVKLTKDEYEELIAAIETKSYDVDLKYYGDEDTDHTKWVEDLEALKSKLQQAWEDAL